MTPPEVRCGMGLGNRVAAIANGLSRAPEIRFVWRVNAHCPAPHSDVFPLGIPGVEFITSAPPAMATRWGSAWCYEWQRAGDHQTAAAAYALVMSHMAGQPLDPPPAVAVIARFHRNPAACPERLAAAVIATGTRGPVFLLADMHRPALTLAIGTARIAVWQPRCQPLAADLQRTRSDLADYLSDWLTALSAPLILALDGPASALHPARAAGVAIRYV